MQLPCRVGHGQPLPSTGGEQRVEQGEVLRGERRLRRREAERLRAPREQPRRRAAAARAAITRADAARLRLRLRLRWRRASGAEAWRQAQTGRQPRRQARRQARRQPRRRRRWRRRRRRRRRRHKGGKLFVMYLAGLDPRVEGRPILVLIVLPRRLSKARLRCVSSRPTCLGPWGLLGRGSRPVWWHTGVGLGLGLGLGLALCGGIQA